MSTSGLPAEVQALLDQRLQTLDQLEGLLLLRGAPDKAWSLDELSVRLKGSFDLAEEAMQQLERSSLASARGIQWCYRAGAHDAAVDALAKVWREQPLEVLRQLNRNSVSRVRDFADAFLVRRKKDG